MGNKMLASLNQRSHPDEANIPAKPEQAKSLTRVSQAHEHGGWSKGDQAAESKRAAALDRLSGK